MFGCNIPSSTALISTFRLVFFSLPRLSFYFYLLVSSRFHLFFFCPQAIHLDFIVLKHLTFNINSRIILCFFWTDRMKRVHVCVCVCMRSPLIEVGYSLTMKIQIIKLFTIRRKNDQAVHSKKNSCSKTKERKTRLRWAT